MKKVFKLVFLGFVFTTASIFMSCSDVITGDESQQVENSSEETNISGEAPEDFGRYCFGGNIGRTGTSGYSNHCNYRGCSGRSSGRSHR